MITKSLSEGFKFAFSIKRIIPYLVIYLIAFYALIDFVRRLSLLITETTGISSFLTAFGVYIPLFIIIALVQLWIKGAIIDQARFYQKKRKLSKSFEYAASRYLTMFCASILYGIIAFIVSLPRYLGGLFALVVSLVFFFLYPAIIIDKRKCTDAFKKSFWTFMHFPLETFVTWLLVMVIYSIITLIFALPAIFYLIGSITPPEISENITITERTFAERVIPRLSASVSSAYFIPYLFIFSLALAFSSVFANGTQARLYINSRKLEI